MATTKTMSWNWILVAGVSAALPPLFVKAWTRSNSGYRWTYLALSALCYALIIYAYTKILVDRAVGTAYTAIKIVTILAVVGMGFVLFGERLSAVQIVGLILALLAIYLLAR